MMIASNVSPPPHSHQSPHHNNAHHHHHHHYHQNDLHSHGRHHSTSDILHQNENSPVSTGNKNRPSHYKSSSASSVVSSNSLVSKYPSLLQDEEHQHRNRDSTDASTSSNNDNNNNNAPLMNTAFTSFTHKTVNNTSKSSCETAERCVSACAAYGRVCPCTARISAQAAYDAVLEIRKDSPLFGQDLFVSGFTYLNPDDVTCDGGDKRLGEGGFSYVTSCHILTGKDAGQEFAMKYLKRKIMVDLHQFKHGAADLAIEAHFLQALDHPNIIKLHGVAAGDMRQNIACGKERAFFIVVDKLVDTLEELIHRWSEEREQNNRLLARWSPDYKENKKKDLFGRLRIASQVACAMEYLHSLNVVYRDLKPDNIGFNKTGIMQLFDFGLAKELKFKNQRFDGKYELTGNTGSRRYMAPEVARDENYDLSVDVYSFGILLWELCSAEKPFFGYSSDKHMRQVVMEGERPKMDSTHTIHWPMNLQWLMTRCWSDTPSQRPTFSVVRQVIQDILLCKNSIPPSLPSNNGKDNAEANSSHSGSRLNRGGSGGDEDKDGRLTHLPIPSFFRHKRSQTTCLNSPIRSPCSQPLTLTGEAFSPQIADVPYPDIPKPDLGHRRQKTWGFGRRR